MGLTRQGLFPLFFLLFSFAFTLNIATGKNGLRVDFCWHQQAEEGSGAKVLRTPSCSENLKPISQQW